MAVPGRRRGGSGAPPRPTSGKFEFLLPPVPGPPRCCCRCRSRGRLREGPAQTPGQDKGRPVRAAAAPEGLKRRFGAEAANGAGGGGSAGATAPRLLPSRRAVAAGGGGGAVSLLCLSIEIFNFYFFFSPQESISPPRPSPVSFISVVFLCSSFRGTQNCWESSQLLPAQVVGTPPGPPLPSPPQIQTRRGPFAGTPVKDKKT